MTPATLRAWRKDLGLTQLHAAEALGKSLAMYKLYERGKHSDDRPVEIPQTVQLACAALTMSGVPEYGPVDWETVAKHLLRKE